MIIMVITATTLLIRCYNNLTAAESGVTSKSTHVRML